MNDIKHIIFFIELIILEGGLAWYFERRSKFWLRFLISVAAIATVCFFLPMITSTIWFIIAVLGIFLATIGIWILCCKESIYNVIFACVVGYTLEHLISESFQWFYFGLLPKECFQYFNTINVAVTMVLALLIACLIGLKFGKKMRKSRKNIANGRGVLFVGCITLIFAIIISSYSGGISIRNTTTMHVTHAYAVTVCIVVLVLLWFMANNNRLTQELTLTQALINRREEQYEYTKTASDLINAKYHDLKYHLLELRKNGNGVNDEFIKELDEAIALYGSEVKTGNEALDVILTDKNLYSKKNNIVFSCVADGSKLSFMETSDIYALFGNAVDNAIEAVMHLPNENDRRISIQIKNIGNMLIVRVENKFDGKIAIKNGVFQTSKQEKDYHGFGIKSMQLITQKYGGALTCVTNNDFFVLKIIFPLKSNK